MMQIRNSIKAIVIQDNQLLVTKLEDADGIYYLLPGGGQEPGEKMHEALIRECIEETGYIVDVQELMFIRECFMVKDTHRVEMMFRCRIAGETQQTNMDQGQLGIAWIDLGGLADEPLFPAELRARIQQAYANEAQTVYLGEID